MDQTNPVATFIKTGFIRQKYNQIATTDDIKWYQQTIGSLLYAALLTRPDIAYIVNTLAKYSSNPGPEYIKAVKRIFRYLKGLLDYTITYNSNITNNQYTKGYTDADYAGDKDEYKSITGYIFYLAKWTNSLFN